MKACLPAGPVSEANLFKCLHGKFFPATESWFEYYHSVRKARQKLTIILLMVVPSLLTLLQLLL